MAFCKFSSSYVVADKTSVDNAFITDFLPTAPESCVKVYLLGLSRCHNASANDNNVQNFANILGLSEEDVRSAFLYWQEQGVVQIVNVEPYEVRYLPLNQNIGNIKKFKIGKYNDFNLQMQEIVSDRMLTPNEFAEYYTLIESFNMSQEAVLMIAKYCVDYRGTNVGYSYITTVAKNWLNEAKLNGASTLTAEMVEQKIEELGILDDKLQQIFKALGSKRKAQIEDKQMLNKWLDAFGFEFGVIIYVAKALKLKKMKCDMFNLDYSLTKYFEMQLLTEQEIENFEQEKQNLLTLAKGVVKNLGLYYEDLTKTIEIYILPQTQMGYDEKMLLQIAEYCFKNNIRTLDGFDKVVKKLFKLGIVKQEDLQQYFQSILQTDKQIAEILAVLNLSRNVNSFDRNFYATWTNVWEFEQDVILHAATLAVGKQNPMQYLNKILSDWNSKGVKTLELAKKQNANTTTPIAQSSNKRKYNKEELASIFANLDEVEI